MFAINQDRTHQSFGGIQLPRDLQEHTGKTGIVKLEMSFIIEFQ